MSNKEKEQKVKNKTEKVEVENPLAQENQQDKAKGKDTLYYPL